MDDKNTADPIKVTSIRNEANGQFLIVAIGASAGGIKALKEFFSHVPADSGMAYVVILHLSPEFESKLAEILQTVTAVPVTQIMEERLKVVPNNIYVMPPNKSLTMTDGHLALSPIESFEERRAPIDVFFRTLADSNDGRAISVVLSGTGSDGSMGMKRIKENGGIVLVQDPKEAEYEDMPRNSIAQGLVDFVLPVKQMPAQIIHYSTQRENIHITVKSEEVSKEEEHEKALREIFTQIRIKTGNDFSNYKRATILRRIERRMNVREVDDLPAYAKLIHDEKEEPQILLKELLISVTNFFRDRVAFEALEKQVLPKIFENKNSQDVIRIWASACATGEEAYSIAMLCAERLSDINDPPSVQIFATDIDDPALTIAREGFYSNTDAADVSPDRLRKFFIKESGGFRIRRELRETILFARHNIIKDPPFSRIDLIACRNLLIYFNRTAQARIMETFHFALNPGGYLFLGSSETVDSSNNLFTIVNREQCIFQNRATVARPPLPLPDLTTPLPFSELRKDILPLDSESRLSERISAASLHYQLLELYSAPSVLINEEYDIIHISKTAGRYLQMAGEPSLNLLNVILPELRLELRGALYNAMQTGKTIYSHNLRIRIKDQDEQVTLKVKALTGEIEAAKGFILIQFEASETKALSEGEALSLPSQDKPIALHLEGELLHTRAQLRQTREQFEVQTEEFKASNEELQAINEELRSAAEELETSKEELQSVNEELRTVNQELKVKIDELSQSNNDFKNLMSATHIGTIFLDRTFGINLFTPAASEIFNFKPADYGRPLSDITNRLLNTNIMADVETVTTTLQPSEREVKTIDGLTYLMSILPYRTSEDHINGIVVTFVDISARKDAEEALKTSEERMRAMFEQARAGLAQVDLNGKLTMVNKRYCNMLGYKENELLGRQIQDFVHPESQHENARLFGQVVTSSMPFEIEQRHICKNGNTVWLHDNVTLVRDNTGAAQSILVISIDVTSQRLIERQKDDFIGIASHELKTPVTSIKAYTQVLKEKFGSTGDVESEKLMSKLEGQIDRMTNLIGELLDTTRIMEGRLEPNKTSFDPVALVKEVVEMMQYTTKKHKLQLDMGQLPVFTGDRERIGQVITNLISNAIKYAPDNDKIIIRAGVQHDQMSICIQDFGKGLAEEDIERIFNRFYRVKDKSISTYPGMGLGLYISMEIAKLHQGTITVKSTKGQGATFCLLLPLSCS